MSYGTCPCDTPEPHPVSECIPPGQTNDEVFADDVRALLLALGLGDHARPYSAHAVIHREVLPAVADALALRERVEALHKALHTRAEVGVADWGTHVGGLREAAYELRRLLDGPP